MKVLMPTLKTNFVYLFLIIILNTDCKKQVAALDYPKPIDSSMIGNIKTVVILGTSIVLHGPDPSIGWYGNWGMAASSIDSDFVHILIRNLQSKNNRIVVKYRNIADFETGFTSFLLGSVVSLRSGDIIVMKISENVQPNSFFYPQFITYYDILLHYLDPSGKAVKLIVDGFWEKDKVNTDIRNYALQKNIP